MAVELPPSPSTALTNHHHVTIGVMDPQGDFDWHTKVVDRCCAIIEKRALAALEA